MATDAEKDEKRRKFKEGLKNLGRTIAGAGLTTLGGSIAGPAGAMVARGVAKKLGLEPDTDPAIINTEVQSSPEIIVKLREMDARMAEAHARIAEAEETGDSERIAAVNETMRAEILANPAAGAWRPLWGKWSCWFFFPIVSTVVIYFGVCLFVTKDAESAKLCIEFLGAVFMVMTVPMTILGVSAWHRGKEKRVLAGENSPSIFGMFKKEQSDEQSN